MKTIALLIFTGLLLAMPRFARAIELGDPAPPLAVSDWVKGHEVHDFHPGTVYVVEFWATWCPPCRETIPHLTDLQKKYGDRVVFIGVSVDEEQEKIAPFVKQMGDKMQYIVAADDKGKTEAAFMKAFGVDTLPHAFIVDAKGRIVWHCIAGDGTLEKVLEEVVGGQFDLAGAKQRMARLEEEERDRRKHLAFAQAYLSQVSVGEVDENEAREAGKSIEQKVIADARVANLLAWQIVGGERVKFRDVALALRLSKSAVDLTGGKDSDVLDTYAQVLFANERVQDAIAAEKKAIGLCTDPEALADLKKNLARYEADAKDSK